MRIKSDSAISPVMMIVLSMVTFGVPALLLYLASQRGPVPALLYLFATLFFGVALLLLFVGTRQLIRSVRFGSWELECPDTGCVLGQSLHVRLFPGRMVMPEGDVQCHLERVHSVMTRATTSRRGGSRDVETTTLWETKWSVPPATIDPRIGLDISLPLPDKGQETSDTPPDGSRGSISWHLTLLITANGIAHEPSFQIPVPGGAAFGREVVDSSESEEE